jgi:hypothetical protein
MGRKEKLRKSQKNLKQPSSEYNISIPVGLDEWNKIVADHNHPLHMWLPKSARSPLFKGNKNITPPQDIIINNQ